MTRWVVLIAGGVALALSIVTRQIVGFVVDTQHVPVAGPVLDERGSPVGGAFVILYDASGNASHGALEFSDVWHDEAADPAGDGRAGSIVGQGRERFGLVTSAWSDRQWAGSVLVTRDQDLRPSSSARRTA